MCTSPTRTRSLGILCTAISSLKAHPEGSIQSLDLCITWPATGQSSLMLKAAPAAFYRTVPTQRSNAKHTRPPGLTGLSCRWSQWQRSLSYRLPSAHCYVDVSTPRLPAAADLVSMIAQGHGPGGGGGPAEIFKPCRPLTKSSRRVMWDVQLKRMSTLDFTASSLFIR